MALAETALEKKPKGNLALLNEKLEEYKGQIAAALPKHLTSERLIRIALTAVSRSENLQLCTWTSVAGCVVQAAILGWEPNTILGECYLIPFWNSKIGERGGYECQLQPGYQGLLKLCHNSGQIETVGAEAVYENDFFEYENGFDPHFRHVPARKDRGEITDYYAFSKTQNGGKFLSVMTVDEIETHRDKYSQSAYKRYKGKLELDPQGNKILQGPWKDSPYWMYAKTPLKKMMKLLPKSAEMQAGLSLDERHEAALPQQFSFDVPLELHPAPAAEQDAIEVQPELKMPEPKSKKKAAEAQQAELIGGPEDKIKAELIARIDAEFDIQAFDATQRAEFLSLDFEVTREELPSLSVDRLTEIFEKLKS